MRGTTVHVFMNVRFLVLENDHGNSKPMIIYRVDGDADFDDNTESAILPNTDRGHYRYSI